ncbi:uncharacterized protein [Clytia hemisphaerica]|uniref:uncharacterized protein n=1 Tax=Clytia hemisphaerica TaxID=252671 RepID=UPI0034D6C02A
MSYNGIINQEEDVHAFLSSEDFDEPPSKKPRLKKCCQTCKVDLPSIASKTCNACGSKQRMKRPRNEEDLDQYVPKGKIDPCEQKFIIRKRCYILNKKENYHCVVLHLSGTKRVAVDSYATPGFAHDFMTGLSVESSKFGDVIKDTFKTAYKQFLKKQEQSEAENADPPEGSTFSENYEAPEKLQTPKPAAPESTVTVESTVEGSTSFSDNYEAPDNLQALKPVVPESTVEDSNIISKKSPESESAAVTQSPVQASGSREIPFPWPSTAQKIVEGVLELSKKEVKAGMIVPVYANPAHPSNDSFWLFLLSAVSVRKIKGVYLERDKSSTGYILGQSESLTWNCIVRKNTTHKTFYAVEMAHKDGVYNLPSLGTQFLNIKTN